MTGQTKGKRKGGRREWGDSSPINNTAIEDGLNEGDNGGEKTRSKTWPCSHLRTPKRPSAPQTHTVPLIIRQKRMKRQGIYAEHRIYEWASIIFNTHTPS